MRETLFRGKREDNGEWVIGYLVRGKDYLYETEMTTIFSTDTIFYPYTETSGYNRVIADTVGQFTGVYDKNGNKIFEGDIIHIKCGYGFSAFVGKGIVFFDEKRLQFRVKSVKPSSFDSEKGNVYDECDFTVIDSYEVVGNIYENPELLEEL